VDGSRERTPERGLRAGRCGVAPRFDKRGRQTAACHNAEAFAIVGAQPPRRGVQSMHRLFEDRIEHRRKIARCAVDDAQKIGRGTLVFERFFEIVGALA